MSFIVNSLPENQRQVKLISGSIFSAIQACPPVVGLPALRSLDLTESRDVEGPARVGLRRVHVIPSKIR